MNERRLLRLLGTPMGKRLALLDRWDREYEEYQKFVVAHDRQTYERRLHAAEIELRVWQKKPRWLRPFTKPDTFALELAGRYPITRE